MLDTKTNFVDEKVEIDPKDLQVSFDNNTTETKDTETKDKETNNDSKIVKVSLGNDAEALAEEKSKPKDKQDKNKIKQLEKSIKDREKEIKDQVKNNKKYKPNTNAWNGVIDDENADDLSYIVNNWKLIPQKSSFINAANGLINKDTKNVAKDREYYLNLTQRGFEEWNGMQENPDDPDNYKKWEEENQKWKDNVDKALEKYTEWDKDKESKYYYSSSNLHSALSNAKAAGDYDAAVILNLAYRNAKENEKWENNIDKVLEKYTHYDKDSEYYYTSNNLSYALINAEAEGDYEAVYTLREAYKNAVENEKAQKEKPAKDGEQTFTKEEAWEIYYSPTGTAIGLFENFNNTLGMTAEEARKEFLSKNPNPSESAKKAFRDVYKTELVEGKVTASEEDQTENLQVGGKAPRETLNEAQSKVSKNIKDLVLDEVYQTLTDDEKRDALKKATERALNEYSSSFIDKVNAREDAAQLSKFLPRFAIQHYLEGDFGERKTPKSLGTLGYFLLDKVGKSLVNASQVARGFSPTERTVLEDYNKTMLENAFDRDNENRKKILMSSLDTLIKDSEVLRELGISDFKVFDNFTEKVLTQYQDNIQNVNLDKILKEKADFIENLPEAEKNKYIGYIIATGVSEPDSAAYLVATYREAEMELKFAKTDAEKYAAQKSKMEIDLKLNGIKTNNELLSGQLDSVKIKNEKDRATMTAEIEAVILENKQLIEDIKKARTENEYLAKEKEKELEKKVADIVSTYATVGTNIGDTVANIIDAVIPGKSRGK